MTTNSYPIEKTSLTIEFEFISHGKNGDFTFIIQFRKISEDENYFIKYGVKNNYGCPDLNFKTNNDDYESLYGTILNSCYMFTEMYPSAIIFCQGNLMSKIKLMNRGIKKYYDEMIHDFEIYGELNNNWYEFSKHFEYNKFVFKRRKYSI